MRYIFVEVEAPRRDQCTDHLSHVTSHSNLGQSEAAGQRHTDSVSSTRSTDLLEPGPPDWPNHPDDANDDFQTPPETRRSIDLSFSRSAAKMPSLLVVVFLIELVVQLINTIGAATINNLVRSPAMCSHPSARVSELLLTLRPNTAMADLPLPPDAAGQGLCRSAPEAKGIPRGSPGAHGDEQPGRVCQVGKAAPAARQAAG